jgi:hypothetical protein
MAFNYSPKIIQDGLVLYLDAANTKSYPTTGTTWTDLSRSGNNGTLINGPTFNSGNGGSIVFDGVNDYVNLGNSTSIQTGINNFSWSVWVKTPSNFNGYKMILSSDVFWCYLSLYNNQFTFDTNPGGGGNNVNRFGTLQINTWYNATVVRNNNIDYCYINGTFINSVSDSFNVTGTFNIGRWNYNNTLYYNSITDTEISQNFNATKTRFGL